MTDYNPTESTYAPHDPLRLAGARAPWVRDFREIRAGYAARLRDNGHAFAVATELGPMTDWNGHRGQTSDSRRAAAEGRAQHFAGASLSITRRLYSIRNRERVEIPPPPHFYPAAARAAHHACWANKETAYANA